ncbi:LOW QUALITY PROTEIN: advanced glycosylation end product-specific receptor [Lycaon pictus]
MAAGAAAAAGAWVLVLSLWGEPQPTPILPSSSSPNLPRTLLEPKRYFPSSLTHLLLAPQSPPTPPPLSHLPGAVVGDRNITARIGKPLVLNCRGAPKKPPQQLEWKLVSRAPATAPHSQGPVMVGGPTSLSHKSFQRTCTVQALLCPQNTGRTEAWKVLSPQGGPWDSVARVLPNGSLLLPAVGIQDEGTFRCRATSRNGKETRSTYQVRVYRKSSRAISMAYLSSQEKPSTLALDSWPWCVRTCTPGVEESVKLQPLTEIFSTSEIPGKPEIINPASELMAGVPSKVGTCVSEGGYPAGTLSWHWDGKPLIPDGKGVSVQEETRRHPETGLFTLQSELMVTPAQGGAPHPTFSCSFSPGLPRRQALHAAPIQLNVWESVPLEVQVMVEPGGMLAPGGTVTLTCETPAQSSVQIHWIKDGMPLPLPPSPMLVLSEVKPEDQGTYSCVAMHPSHGSQESRGVSVVIETDKEGPTTGYVEGQGLGTVALALGILGGLGIAVLLIGAIMWRRRQRQRQERKAPENQEEEEEEEERTELNQSEEPEAAESGAAGP